MYFPRPISLPPGCPALCLCMPAKAWGRAVDAGARSPVPPAFPMRMNLPAPSFQPSFCSAMALVLCPCLLYTFDAFEWHLKSGHQMSKQGGGGRVRWERTREPSAALAYTPKLDRCLDSDWLSQPRPSRWCAADVAKPVLLPPLCCPPGPGGRRCQCWAPGFPALFSSFLQPPVTIANRPERQQASRSGAQRVAGAQVRKPGPPTRPEPQLHTAGAMAARLNDPASGALAPARRCCCALPESLRSICSLLLCVWAAARALQVLEEATLPLIVVGRLPRALGATRPAFPQPLLASAAAARPSRPFSAASPPPPPPLFLTLPRPGVPFAG